MMEVSTTFHRAVHTWLKKCDGSVYHSTVVQYLHGQKECDGSVYHFPSTTYAKSKEMR